MKLETQNRYDDVQNRVFVRTTFDTENYINCEQIICELSFLRSNIHVPCRCNDNTHNKDEKLMLKYLEMLVHSP